jgi:S-(hydroxymethyl)mycothiol dehydrogenase
VLVDQYHLGRLDVDAFVTETIGLGQVNQTLAGHLCQ